MYTEEMKGDVKMQVERELVVRVKTSDGITLKPGDMVALTARGYTYVGKYLGMSGRGGIIV